jgi:hypothetical protein
VARAAASIVLVGALLVGTSGCTFLSPKATLIHYDPSDGVGASVGALKIRNAIAVIDSEGGSVSLLVTIINSSSRSVRVNLQFESDGEKTTVTKVLAANSVTSFGNTAIEEKIVVVKPGVAAGELFPLYVQYGKEPGVQLLVPVLEAAGSYADLAPTPTPTAPAPAVPIPSPTATP